MMLPGDLAELRGASGAAAFAAPELQAWVRAALERGEPLHDAAAREADGVLHGRGPAPIVTTPSGRWVVRRYQRGGRVAAPLLRDRYLRVGAARPLREAHASAEARRRGIPTPRVVAGAVYPAGAFYRADLVTEYVADAVDLARLLFEQQRAPDERLDVLDAVGRLIARAAAAGIEHPDLNAKNVLVVPGGASPLLLDLDRCRVHPEGERGDAERMLGRLERSLRKHERRTGRAVRAGAWFALAAAARAGAAD